MSDDFELEGEGEMDPTSSMTFSKVITYYVKSGTRIAEQASICVMHVVFFLQMADRFAR